MCSAVTTADEFQEKIVITAHCQHDIIQNVKVKSKYNNFCTQKD